AGERTSMTDRPAMRRVTSPRQSVTTSRVASGSRPPIAMPASAPTSTVVTLRAVPAPAKSTWTVTSGTRGRVPEEAGEPSRADAVARLVGDGDLVARDGAAEAQRRGGPGDPSG